VKLDRREFMVSAAAGVAEGRTRPRAGAPHSWDAASAREEFPAAARSAYLNTPYIGPIPRSVERAGSDFVRAKAEDPISLGAMLEKTNEARKKFAELFGASPNEIGFLFSTSEGENLVTSALDLRPGDNVVVDDLHYTTTYVLYKSLERKKGIELRIAPSVAGRADRENFEPYVDSRTRLLSVSWVSHQNGFRHDLRDLASLAHAHGALLYADGIQALGMFRTRLREEGVDFVASGTYKWLFASYGVAPFFIREEHLDRIPPDRMGALALESEGPNYEFRLYPGARRYEYATLAFEAVYQLDAALDYLAKMGLGNIEDHTFPLAAEMKQGLVDLGYRVRTPSKNASAIVAFIHGKDPEKAQKVFERREVRVSFREGGTQVRAGAALFNNKEDVRRFLEAAEEVRDL
jgi:selenocysteine lyase/cysteine desulfurase